MRNLKFDDFEPVRSRGMGKPCVTITARSAFRFNSDFIRTYVPSKPKYVSIKFAQDLDFYYLGFIFSDDPDKLKGPLSIYYPTREGGKVSNGSTQAASFFTKYGINPKRYANKYFADEYDDKEKGHMFLIKLKK